MGLHHSGSRLQAHGQAATPNVERHLHMPCCDVRQADACRVHRRRTCGVRQRHAGSRDDEPNAGGSVLQQNRHRCRVGASPQEGHERGALLRRSRRYLLVGQSNTGVNAAGMVHKKHSDAAPLTTSHRKHHTYGAGTWLQSHSGYPPVCRPRAASGLPAAARRLQGSKQCVGSTACGRRPISKVTAATR